MTIKYNSSMLHGLQQSDKVSMINIKIKKNFSAASEKLRRRQNAKTSAHERNIQKLSENSPHQ